MPAVTELRADLGQLVALSATDLQALFREQSLEALFDLLPPLMDTYGLAAATVAADWYDATREEAGVAKRFIAEPIDKPDSGVRALLGWAKNQATDDASLRTLVAGGFQRRLVDFGRDTVRRSALRDPGAQGWQRVSHSKCEFCDMLAGRGAVYTEESVDFASHDWCQCQAEPAWKGQGRPVKPYAPSKRNSTEADRARVRAWIKANQ